MPSHGLARTLHAAACRSMTGEGGFNDDVGAYGSDPLACLGDELRERAAGD